MNRRRGDRWAGRRATGRCCINDRFDIWEFDPNGVTAPVMLTDSLGQREHITFRTMALGRDEDERFLDTAKPTWLSAFDEDTKESGFYRTTLDKRRAPEKVLMDPVRYGTPTKADKADVYMLTRSTFSEFPNLYVGSSIATATNRITDANAFQKEYLWGSAELVEWISADGVPRQGILYKPEGFDPGKKYPMITYFYEDLSDGLHSYIAPNGGTSVNITHYVSNGYLMFEPDIYYEDGHPGQSALKSIIPGVQKLVDRGCGGPEEARPAGAFMGRLPDCLHGHADEHVRGRRGRCPGGEHDERVRRYPLGERREPRDAVRERTRAASASRCRRGCRCTSRTRRSSRSTASRRRC